MTDSLQVIRKHLERFIDISDDAWEYYISFVSIKNYPAKTKILVPCDFSNFEAYVLNGLLRLYVIDENNQEVTIHFAKEDWWVGDMNSFLNNKPSQFYIETIEPTTLASISFENKEMIYKKFPIFERCYRLIFQKTHFALMERLIGILSKTAEVRYQSFIEKYPDIQQRVAQHYIASYLGITPVFLSKIRAKKK
jgi:CRP/FNR family cyclic AMP-dependent transcriptional regulator